MDATRSSPPIFCTALEPSTVCVEEGYEVSAELFHLYGYSDTKSFTSVIGHPGIMYNVIDHKNFDYVYFRCV